LKPIETATHPLFIKVSVQKPDKKKQTAREKK
jgi:hypothetical protein